MQSKKGKWHCGSCFRPDRGGPRCEICGVCTWDGWSGNGHKWHCTGCWCCCVTASSSRNWSAWFLQRREMFAGVYLRQGMAELSRESPQTKDLPQDLAAAGSLELDACRTNIERSVAPIVAGHRAAPPWDPLRQAAAAPSSLLVSSFCSSISLPPLSRSLSRCRRRRRRHCPPCSSAPREFCVGGRSWRSSRGRTLASCRSQGGKFPRHRPVDGVRRLKRREEMWGDGGRGRG